MWLSSVFTLQTLWPHWGSFPHLSNKELNDCNLNISSQLTVYGFVMVNDLQNPWKERLQGHLGCRHEPMFHKEGLTLTPSHSTSFHIWPVALFFITKLVQKRQGKKPSTIPFPRRNNCKRFLSIISAKNQPWIQEQHKEKSREVFAHPHLVLLPSKCILFTRK